MYSSVSSSSLPLSSGPSLQQKNLLMAYLLRDPQVIEYALDRLDPAGDFTAGELAHQLIWSVSADWYRKTGKPIGREHLFTQIADTLKNAPDMGGEFIVDQLREVIEDAYEPDAATMDSQAAIDQLLLPMLHRRVTDRLSAIAHESTSGYYTMDGLIEELNELMGDAVSRCMGGGNGLGQLVELSDVQSEEVQWLWPDRLARGEMHIMAGEPGTRKSYLTMDIAARVSSGSPWPDKPGVNREPADVIILSAEDSITKTIKPRLVACGCDPARVHVHQSELGGGLNMKEHVVQLSQMIDRVENPALLIIDPIGAFFGKTDTHRDSEVREVLAKVQTMAARNNMAVLLVAHLNKNENQRAINRVNGSIGLMGAVRMGWLVIADKQDDNLRHLSCVKNNLGIEVPGMSYRLSEQCYGMVAKKPRIVWDDKPLTVKADELMRQSKAPGKQELAAEFLLDLLANGPVLVERIRSAADAAGHAWKTVERAKRDLRIKSRPSGYAGPRVWCLPEHVDREPGVESIDPGAGEAKNFIELDGQEHTAPKPTGPTEDDAMAKLRELFDKLHGKQSDGSQDDVDPELN
jgi:AAA domain